MDSNNTLLSVGENSKDNDKRSSNCSTQTIHAHTEYTEGNEAYGEPHANAVNVEGNSANFVSL